MNTHLTDLIPHRPPMLLLERLVRCVADEAEAIACFAADSPWVRKGVVPEGMLIEALSQTAAAINGLEARRAGLNPGGGMLVAIKGFSAVRPARVAVPLRLIVHITRRLPPFTIAQGEVWQDDTMIACGELRFHIGEDGTNVQP